MDQRASVRPSIGLVALNALPLFDESAKGSFGGMETRCAILARGLVSRGWNVSVFVRSCGVEALVNYAGVLLRRYDPFWLQMELEMRGRFTKRRWFPIINGTRDEISLLWRVPLYLLYRPFPQMFGSRFWGRWQGMSAVLCFGNSDVSARTIADCRRFGIPAYLMIASDSDLDERYTEFASGFNTYGATHSACWYAISHATQVIVQTEAQQLLLSNRFGRSGILIRNPLPTVPKLMSSESPKRKTALWVGRADLHHKRPQICFDLAKELPEVEFTMVLDAPTSRQFKELARAAPANVRMLERIPSSKMWDLLSEARVFVSTSSSEFEGFPNVFLQAALAKVPIVSLEVDPDGLFSKIGGGFCGHGDFSEFVGLVRKVWTDSSFAEEAFSKLSLHVQTEHSLEASLDVLIQAVGTGQLASTAPESATCSI
jgi:hypothetical protein